MSASKTDQPKWLTKPTTSHIKSLSYDSMYRSGLSIHNKGEVIKTYVTKNNLTAVIKSDQTYHVDIDYRETNFDYSCTCDVSVFSYQVCQHVIAAFIYLKNNFDDLLEEEASRLDSIKYFMDCVKPNEALKFFNTYMSANPLVMEKFIKQFHLEDVHPPRDYAAQLNRMYLNARKNDDGRIDFGSMFAEARERQKRKEFSESTKMYREISKAIRGNMGTFNDKDGYHVDCCIEALENMVDSIVMEGLSHQDKQFHIKDILNEFLKLNDQQIMQYYYNAMGNICTDTEDLLFLEGLLAPYLANPKLAYAVKPDMSGSSIKTVYKTVQNMLGLPATTPYRVKSGASALSSKPVPSASVIRKERLAGIVWMQAHILEETGRTDDALTLLEKHATLSKDLCIRYLYLIKNTSSGSVMTTMTTTIASRKALKAVDEFPKDRHVMDAALELLPIDSKDYAALLKKLLVTTSDTDYADRLKKCFLDWNDNIDDLLNTVKKISPSKAVEICVNDDMYDKALDILESAGSMSLFYTFHSKFAKKEPERFATAYCKALEKSAKTCSSEADYRHIEKSLAKIRMIPGSDEQYGKLVKTITKNKSVKKRLNAFLKNA